MSIGWWAATRSVNEAGVKRLIYDMTGKPPGTIEQE
jgi:GMP synthase PP-ATPase subunit